MSRNLSGSDPAWWHQRYVRQAEWTRALRQHLYRRLEIARCQSILEIGCGTGVIANELAGRTSAAVHGLDNDPAVLALAKDMPGRKVFNLAAGDAGDLPYEAGSFDLVVTHYFWLWAERPGAVLEECRRVLKKGGRVAALAEPDYSKRIDHPDGHPAVKEFLSDDLKKRGADPEVGGKLKDILSLGGLKVETGSVTDKVAFLENPEMFGQEWELLEKLGYPQQALRALREGSGGRWMTAPVCWAIGRKNDGR